MSTSKICIICKQSKHIDEFWKRSRNKSGYVNGCKECLKSGKRFKEPEIKNVTNVLKTCTKCKLQKDTSEFWKASKSKDGFREQCAECCKSLKKQYDRLQKERNELQVNNTKKCTQCGQIKEFSMFFRETNGRCGLKGKCKECVQKVKVSYNREKKRTNNAFRIECNIRRRILNALTTTKKGKIYKSDSTFELLGCDVKYLMEYLENKFLPGMTWENYGMWHIDHIRPCASYDLSDPDEQKKCFNFTNLQPLWAKDNLKKGKKSQV